MQERRIKCQRGRGIMVGCRKEINPYALCGDIGFNNKILLCDECDALHEGDAVEKENEQ